MTHEDIQANDIVDRYVRRDLPAGDAAAFEEHFFECDACFAEVEAADRFANAVRGAAAAGWFAEDRAKPSPVPAWAWMSMAASIALASAVAWSWLVTIPELRSQLPSSARAAVTKTPDVAAPVTPVISANLPVVILTAERSVAPARTIVPADAREVVLWIEGPATGAPDGARLEVIGTDGNHVAVVPNLLRNSSGAYVVSLPPSIVPAGTYRLRLYSSHSTDAALLGEYAVIFAAAK